MKVRIAGAVGMVALASLACAGTPPEEQEDNVSMISTPKSPGLRAAASDSKGTYLMGDDGRIWKGAATGWVDLGVLPTDLDSLLTVFEGKPLVLNGTGAVWDGGSVDFPAPVRLDRTMLHALDGGFVSIPVAPECDSVGQWFRWGEAQWKSLPVGPVASHTAFAHLGDRLYALGGVECDAGMGTTAGVWSIPWPPPDDAAWRAESALEQSLAWRSAAAFGEGIVLAGVMDENESAEATFWRPDGELVSKSTPADVKSAVRPFLLVVGKEVFVTGESWLYAWEPKEDHWRKVTEWSCEAPVLAMVDGVLWGGGWDCSASIVAEL